MSVMVTPQPRVRIPNDAKFPLARRAAMAGSHRKVAQRCLLYPDRGARCPRGTLVLLKPALRCPPAACFSSAKAQSTTSLWLLSPQALKRTEA
ncbi:hypothetical protein NN561_018104 [Cricetulus griseus]